MLPEVTLKDNCKVYGNFIKALLMDRHCATLLALQRSCLTPECLCGGIEYVGKQLSRP